MKELIDRLTPAQDHMGDAVYPETDIRKAADEVIPLAQNGLLAVVVENELHVSFVVFRFASGPTKDRTGAVVAPVMYQRLFHGEGPSGSLRELRHTFWGNADNAGYIHYVRGALIADALDKLRRWFDLD